MLKVSPSPAAAAANRVSGPAATPASVRVLAPRIPPSARTACRAAGKAKEVLSGGFVFQPFEEIINKQGESSSPQTTVRLPSTSRSMWSTINASYAYHSLFAYFDRDNVATRCNDSQLTDFIEGEFLMEQVEDIKKITEYVAQLRRVGKGHGVWHLDQKLLEDEA
ncbi:hypothetical protein BAE44_0023808 [Dichanthelium oligosanthes]|uniref:Ferritin n=1 Tax=Dichanthelium oligosanthes TaxID=888268 RepID=A0A1E5UQN9_9POAL|nr:hypothetical protein BAE44_0023808 [Dichanthelium oligosanthes]